MSVVTTKTGLEIKFIEAADKLRTALTRLGYLSYVYLDDSTTRRLQRRDIKSIH